MLLMPIGVSTVLEFSGAAAVLISPGRVSEVLCCESIPLVITLLRVVPAENCVSVCLLAWL
jgi:hypothetical protein